MNQQLILDISPTPTPTLDNFVIGSNQEVLNALMQCQSGRAIYLYGAPGVGRTHLLQAMAARHHGVYFSASDSIAQLKKLISAESFTQPLVAIDNIEQFSAAGQAAIFALYNRWRECAASSQAFIILVSGEFAPLATKVREDLRTRLGWDLVFRLQHLSDAEREEALRTRALEKSLHLTPEVMHWVLTRYERDMGQLINLIDALDRYSLTRKRHITLPLLRDLLAEGLLSVE
jgi:DnaA family protein